MPGAGTGRRHAGHSLIGEDQLDLVVLENLDAFLAGGARQHAVAAMKLVAQAIQHVRLVIDDQKRMASLLHPVCSGRLDQAFWLRRICEGSHLGVSAGPLVLRKTVDCQPRAGSSG